MNDVYAIEGSQLYKEFPLVGADPIIALDHLDFKIRKGCLTALVGPDGAGKTTLIRLIAGLLDATAGSLEVLGMDVKAHSQAVQDRLSYMPQKGNHYTCALFSIIRHPPFKDIKFLFHNHSPFLTLFLSMRVRLCLLIHVHGFPTTA